MESELAWIDGAEVLWRLFLPYLETELQTSSHHELDLERSWTEHTDGEVVTEPLPSRLTWTDIHDTVQCPEDLQTIVIHDEEEPVSIPLWRRVRDTYRQEEHDEPSVLYPTFDHHTSTLDCTQESKSDPHTYTCFHRHRTRSEEHMLSTQTDCSTRSKQS